MADRVVGRSNTASDFRIDWGLDFDDPRLAELYAYWRSKHRGPLLPGRADINPFELKPLLPHVLLIDVERPALQFRYRLVGTAVVQAVGTDATGRRMEEALPKRLIPTALRAYREAVVRRQAMRLAGRFWQPARSHLLWEAALLPLATDGYTVTMLFGGMTFRHERGGPI